MNRSLLIALAACALGANSVYFCRAPVEAKEIFWLVNRRTMVFLTDERVPDGLRSAFPDRAVASLETRGLMLSGQRLEDAASIVHDEGGYGPHGGNRWTAMMDIPPEATIGMVLQSVAQLQASCNVSVVVGYRLPNSGYLAIDPQQRDACSLSHLPCRKSGHPISPLPSVAAAG